MPPSPPQKAAYEEHRRLLEESERLRIQQETQVVPMGHRLDGGGGARGKGQGDQPLPCGSVTPQGTAQQKALPNGLCPIMRLTQNAPPDREFFLFCDPRSMLFSSHIVRVNAGFLFCEEDAE